MSGSVMRCASLKQTLLALTLGSNLFSRPVTKEPVCAQRSESGFPPHV